MGHLLSHPITSKYVNTCGDRYFRCGAAEMQGFRTNMEDTHNTILHVKEWKAKRAAASDTPPPPPPSSATEKRPSDASDERKSDDLDPSSLPLRSSPAPSTSSSSAPSSSAASSATSSVPNDFAFFAVYDGHSGPAAAEFACVDMPMRAAELADPFDRSAVVKMVLDSDAAFCKNTQVRAHGCTACFALVQPLPSEDAAAPTRYRVLIGNVGDSRCAVIGVDGRIRFVTSDHKPENEAESRRIKAAGGSVSYNRVDGELAMSRAMGDYAYKGQAHLGAQQQKVIALPDVFTLDCVQGEKLLIMCDGLVEKCSNEQVVHFVEQELSAMTQQGSSKGRDPATIVERLIDYSLEKGSKDNMSAMLVLLEDGTDYTRGDEYVPGTIKDGEDDRQFIELYLAYAKRHGIESKACLTMARKADQQRAQTQTAAGQQGRLSTSSGRNANGHILLPP